MKSITLWNKKWLSIQIYQLMSMSKNKMKPRWSMGTPFLSMISLRTSLQMFASILWAIWIQEVSHRWLAWIPIFIDTAAQSHLLSTSKYSVLNSSIQMNQKCQHNAFSVKFAITCLGILLSLGLIIEMLLTIILGTLFGRCKAQPSKWITSITRILATIELYFYSAPESILMECTSADKNT